MYAFAPTSTLTQARAYTRLFMCACVCDDKPTNTSRYRYIIVCVCEGIYRYYSGQIIATLQGTQLTSTQIGVYTLPHICVHRCTNVHVLISIGNEMFLEGFVGFFNSIFFLLAPLVFSVNASVNIQNQVSMMKLIVILL